MSLTVIPIVLLGILLVWSFRARSRTVVACERLRVDRDNEKEQRLAIQNVLLPLHNAFLLRHGHNVTDRSIVAWALNQIEAFEATETEDPDEEDDGPEPEPEPEPEPMGNLFD